MGTDQQITLVLDTGREACWVTGRFEQLRLLWVTGGGILADHIGREFHRIAKRLHQLLRYLLRWSSNDESGES